MWSAVPTRHLINSGNFLYHAVVAVVDEISRATLQVVKLHVCHVDAHVLVHCRKDMGIDVAETKLHTIARTRSCEKQHRIAFCPLSIKRISQRINADL